MDIQNIYATLKRMGLARSHAGFSTIWLGRSNRYFSKLLTTNQQPAVPTLNGLRVRLAHFAASLPDADERHELLELVDDLREHIDRRSIVDIRRRKPTGHFG